MSDLDKARETGKRLADYNQNPPTQGGMPSTVYNELLNSWKRNKK